MSTYISSEEGKSFWKQQTPFNTLPSGVSSMINILEKSDVSDYEKLCEIKQASKERLNQKVVFKRSQHTQDFYKEIESMNYDESIDNTIEKIKTHSQSKLEIQNKMKNELTEINKDNVQSSKNQLSN